MGQYALIKAISAPNYTNCKTSALGQKETSSELVSEVRF